MHGFNLNLSAGVLVFILLIQLVFLLKQKTIKISYYNQKYLSADLDFFYKMIVNEKFKGMSTKKNEIMGKFASGGFSSRKLY